MFTFHSIYFDDQPQAGRVLDLFEADADAPARDIALFFVHGGGWRGGSRTNFHSIMREYARRGFDCASTDYRLQGVYCPDQVADIREGLDLFTEHLVRKNRPQRIVIHGASAGAHLTMLTAFATPEEYGKPEKPLRFSPKIVGVAVQATPFSFEPWEDIFPKSWANMQGIVGKPYEGNEMEFRKASPMHYIRSGQPAVFALHAENEHMYPYFLVEEFKQRSEACGNSMTTKIYPSTEHGFFYSLERWQQREAFEDILEFAESL